MNTLFFITYLFWFLSEIFLNRLLHSKKTDKQDQDKGSLSIIWGLIMISIFLAVYISMAFPMPLSVSFTINYIGLVLILLGILFRFMVIKSLGKFFTVDVTIRENHQIKKDGFYKYIRHPSYTSSLVAFVGFGISLNNYYSLLVVTVLVSIAFLYRIRIEEKVLIDFFGSQYLDYMKKTKKIIPFIY